MLALCGVSVKQWYRGVKHPVRRIRHINYAEYEGGPPHGGGHNGHGGAGCGGVGAGGGVKPPHGFGQKQMSLDQFLHSGSCEVAVQQQIS